MVKLRENPVKFLLCFFNGLADGESFHRAEFPVVHVVIGEEMDSLTVAECVIIAGIPFNGSPHPGTGTGKLTKIADRHCCVPPVVNFDVYQVLVRY